MNNTNENPSTIANGFSFCVCGGILNKEIGMKKSQNKSEKIFHFCFTDHILTSTNKERVN